MNSVLVTGANGFIGQNLCTALAERHNLQIDRYDLGSSEDQLDQYIRKADIIYHLAGINRPLNPSEFTSGNIGFTEQLLSKIEDSGRQIPVVFTSSIQALLNNPYGASKKAAEDAVFAWSEKTGNPVYVFRLPNVFGKWCRPNYNSVVATFCHNIANELSITVNDPSSQLRLVYIDDVVSEFVKLLEENENGLQKDSEGFCLIPRVFETTVGELAEKIRDFNENRRTLVVPSFSGDFERCLYATYVSYLPKNQFGYDLDMKRDHRGWLTEFIKSSDFGQIFISKTKPGITRGNHWHHTKVEKFLVIQGEGSIRFRKINSDEVIEYPVSGQTLQVVDIPTGYTHSITNTGDCDLITLFWSDQIFDPGKPDTYYQEV